MRGCSWERLSGGRGAAAAHGAFVNNTCTLIRTPVAGVGVKPKSMSGAKEIIDYVSSIEHMGPDDLDRLIREKEFALANTTRAGTKVLYQPVPLGTDFLAPDPAAPGRCLARRGWSSHKHSFKSRLGSTDFSADNQGGLDSGRLVEPHSLFDPEHSLVRPPSQNYNQTEDSHESLPPSALPTWCAAPGPGASAARLTSEATRQCRVLGAALDSPYAERDGLAMRGDQTYLGAPGPLAALHHAPQVSQGSLGSLGLQLPQPPFLLHSHGEGQRGPAGPLDPAFACFGAHTKLRLTGPNTYSWISAPTSFVVIYKPNDAVAEREMVSVVTWLHTRSFKVYTDPVTAEKYDLRPYNVDRVDRLRIDAIIAVGGDGTLLYISSLFPRETPPILSFNCGSLGFLTPFSIHDIDAVLELFVRGPISVSHRSRLEAYIKRKTKAGGKGDPKPDGRDARGDARSDAAGAQAALPSAPQAAGPTVYQCMNEITMDRGYSSFMCNLDCYCDNKYFTTIQGDGLIVASSSGSTAYALSAGGVPVHGDINVLCMMPICPHVLSSKEIILPGYTRIKIKVPRDARSTCWASFDSRFRVEVKRGEAIVVTTSPQPINTVSRMGNLSDWFIALTECLNWNRRVRQRGFDDTEAERAKKIGDADSFSD